MFHVLMKQRIRLAGHSPDTVVRDSLPLGRYRLDVLACETPELPGGTKNNHARPYDC